MSVLQGIVETIADGLGKSSDVAFKERIKFSVKYWRAFLIKRDLERNAVDRQLFQTICLPLEYGATDVCCLVTTGCKGLKTISKLPKTVRTKGPFMFSSITTPKYKEIYPLDRVHWSKLPFSRYAKLNLHYDLINGYLYIRNAVNLKYVLISAIWEDPEELPQCHSDEGGIDCYANGDFPIPSDMVTTIIEGIIKSDLRLINPSDQTVEINSDNNDKE